MSKYITIYRVFTSNMPREPLNVHMHTYHRVSSVICIENH